MLREAAIDHRQEPRQEPRQEILRTAARLFQQQGYDATSMNDVAAALKLSKGGLYHHFQSKDEILFHIHFDGADGKCQLRNLRVDRCIMLGEWEQAVPAD